MGNARVPGEWFFKDPLVGGDMAKKNQGPGIQSAAGLIRYFDAEEETAIKIPPVLVLFFAGAVGIAVILMRMYWEF